MPKLSRTDDAVCAEIADELDVPVSEVRRAVVAYFDELIDRTDSSGLSDVSKIYRPDAFAEKAFVVNMPYLGRIGPVYSRYLSWRRDALSAKETIGRSDVRRHYSAGHIERLAAQALNGEPVSVLESKRVPSGLYKTVWLVDSNGKKAARQVIVKDRKDVQD